MDARYKTARFAVAKRAVKLSIYNLLHVRCSRKL